VSVDDNDPTPRHDAPTPALSRIVVIAADARLGGILVHVLANAGHEPVWFQDGRQATAAALDGASLVVLHMPVDHELHTLVAFRQRSDAPVIVLADATDMADKVRALQHGADDCLSKPFDPDELLAHIAARLRRITRVRSQVVMAGGLAIDLERRVVTALGAPLNLTRVEFNLVAALARRPGAAVSRAWLADNVLNRPRDCNERTLDVHFCRLRKKLGVHAYRVVTVWGVGYRLRGD
jgi:DNA-binding response OmpR family regulator